jgi:hypothetical protein
LTSLLFVSCGHKYENTAKQKELYKAKQSQLTDTLICKFTSSTGSLDLFFLQGQLSLPTDIKLQLSDTLTRDIKVCGNFPKDLIDMTSWNYNPKLAFKIVGKTILADTENAVGKVPLFYVTEWTKFNYDRNLWNEKDDMEYPHRKKMVDDIIKYLKLKGETLSSIKYLLGEPSYIDTTEIIYQIEEKYGIDIDPIGSTSLVLEFNKDSIITEVRKDEYKKNSR